MENLGLALVASTARMSREELEASVVELTKNVAKHYNRSQFHNTNVKQTCHALEEMSRAASTEQCAKVLADLKAHV